MKLTGLALFLVLLSTVSFAWWDSSFQYRTPINITSSVSLIDYQVQINPQIYNSTGLVGSWHFSEGSGTRAADSSGNGFDGILTSGPAWAAGRFGNGLQFDGVGSYVDAGNQAALNPRTGNFTIEAWVKGTGVDRMIVRKGFSGGDYMFMFMTSGVLRFNMYDGINDRNTYSTTAINNNAWHHLVGTRTGNTLQVYVDGNAEGTPSTAVLNDVNPNAAFVIGKAGTENKWYFNGTIDEIRIYNRSLSPQEVQALYNASKARLDYADLRFTQQYAVYETPVSISGIGSDLADYQVFVNITDPTLLSHMRADGADLRFFPAATSTPYSSTGLAYWIENISSSQAKVWVKANVSAGGSTIYMYYGNVSAQAQSNGTNTFQLFDDFSGASLDASIWNNIGGTITVGSGYASLTGSGATPWKDGFQSKMNFTDYVLYAKLKGTTNYNPSIMFRGAGPDWDTTYLLTQGATGWRVFKKTSAASYTALDTEQGVFNNNAWESIKLVHNGSSIRVWVNDIALQNFADSTYLGPGSIGVSHWGTAGITYYFDEIRVRKFSATEPSASVGSESIKSSGNEALLSFWLESDKSAWVKALSIPPGDSVLYMYYGNSYASAQGNSSNIFIYFENFDAYASGNTPTGWTTTKSGVLVSSAYRRSGPNSAVFATDGSTPYPNGYTTFPAQSSGFAAEFDVLASAIYSGIAFGNTGGSEDYPSGTGFFFSSNILYHNKSGDYPAIQTPMTAGVWYHLKLEVDPVAQKANAFVDGVKKISGNTILSGITSFNTIKLIIYTATGVSYIDNIFIHKYSPSEPSVSFAGEQVLVVDLIPPVVSIQSPGNSSNYSSASVPLNFTATDASGVSACKYSLNGAANVTLAGCANTSITAQPGANSLVVWAFDGTNWGSASVSFTVDTSPPSVQLQSPLAQAYNSSSVPVNFTVSDNVAVSSCAVTLNGTLNSSSCSNYTLTLSNGAYLLNVSANDTSGNLNSTAVSFNVSLPAGQQPPQSNSTQATTDSNGIAAANVSFSFVPAALKLSAGSQDSIKSMGVSSGVNKTEIRAMLTLKGSPVPNKQVTFTVSQ